VLYFCRYVVVFAANHCETYVICELLMLQQFVE